MGVTRGRLGTGKTYNNNYRVFVVVGGTFLFAFLVLASSVLLTGSSEVTAGTDTRGNPAVDPVSALGSVMLVAPTVAIPKGSKLSPDQLKTISWPRDQVPDRALRYVDEAKDMFTSVALSPDQPITRHSVTPTPPSFGIGEQLPPGHRAVTIDVDATAGIEVWATPGAHVDVLLTYLDPQEGVQKTVIAVEDATVLSRGGSSAPSTSETGVPANSVPQNMMTTVTLAVPVQAAMKIQTARVMGRITLILRNTSDIGSGGPQEVTANDLKKNKASREAPKRSNVPKGFVRFTDQNGKEQTFVLDRDQLSRSEDENF